MIHTDGRRTIANAGPLPGSEHTARLENLARDLAAVYHCTVEEAAARLRGTWPLKQPRNVFPLPSMSDTLISDDGGLD